MSTPAEELRAAVTRLRCEHEFRYPLPGCGKCGVDTRPAIDELAEPLATWLDLVAYGWEKSAELSPGAAESRFDKHPALGVARAINGGEA